MLCVVISTVVPSAGRLDGMAYPKQVKLSCSLTHAASTALIHMSLYIVGALNLYACAFSAATHRTSWPMGWIRAIRAMSSPLLQPVRVSILSMSFQRPHFLSLSLNASIHTQLRLRVREETGASASAGTVAAAW